MPGCSPNSSTAKIVQSAPDKESKGYAANQVADEARHVEVYHRYLTEKLGRSFEVNRHLQSLLQEITTRIMGDESRHVAFGVLALENLYRNELSEVELIEILARLREPAPLHRADPLRPSPPTRNPCAARRRNLRRCDGIRGGAGKSGRKRLAPVTARGPSTAFVTRNQPAG